MKALVTVIGRDRVGIIGGVCSELARHGVNILDIRQTVMQTFFTMMMIVDLTGSALAIEALADRMEAYGREQDLEIRLQRTDLFDAMHQI